MWKFVIILNRISQSIWAVDVFVSVITYQAKAEDLFHLDLAYAPPFSTTKDPVMYTGMILDNAINQGRKLITEDTLSEKLKAGEKFRLWMQG